MSETDKLMLTAIGIVLSAVLLFTWSFEYLYESRHQECLKDYSVDYCNCKKGGSDEKEIFYCLENLKNLLPKK